MQKVHLICNSHIDPVWQWDIDEGVSAMLSTFQSAVNLLEEYDYIFCHNEISLYKYLERFSPALFKKVKQMIKKGKWCLMGGWYLQPDCLMPNGEGFVRQIQANKKYVEEVLEAPFPKTAICFDAFGHSRGLVQIVKKCGQDHYLFWRPWSSYTKEQLVLPEECFLWEGYDGSRIQASRIMGYNTGMGIAVNKIKKDIDFFKDKTEVAPITWGVGNHGGGPSRKDLADIELLIKDSDIEIVHSTPDAYFSEVNPTKVFSQSLIPCMVGCYTSMVGMKQKYRELERLLLFVEKLTSIASLKGILEYPTKLFEEAVEDMMNVQFHDILPGTVVASGETLALTYIQHGMRILNGIRSDAYFALCRGEKVADEGTYPIMVFNPKTYKETQIVECEFSIISTEHFEEDSSHIEIFDGEGNRLPSQTVKAQPNQSEDWRKKVVFLADLDPLSLNRFTAKTIIKPNVQYPYNQDIYFDNGEKRVVISAKTGLIESFVVDGVEYANGKLFEPLCFEDTPDPWGMKQMHVGENAESFELLQNPDGVFDGMHSLQIIEDGEIYLEAEAFFGKGQTRIRIGYKLYKQGNYIDIDVNVFPGEISNAYKLCLPLHGSKYFGEQVFGEEALYQDGRECVAHDYVALENGEKCVEIITPTSFGSSYQDGKIYLTLLRTAAYCAHPAGERPLLRDGIFVPRIDQGRRDFSFRLQITERKALKHNADIFVEKPYALNIFPTKEDQKAHQFQVETDNPTISVVTIKKGTQKEGYLIRLINNTNSTEACKLRFGNTIQHLSFCRYEVKTICYNDGELSECDQMYI